MKMASKRRDLEYVPSITGFTMRHYKRKDFSFSFFFGGLYVGGHFYKLELNGNNL